MYETHVTWEWYSITSCDFSYAVHKIYKPRRQGLPYLAYQKDVLSRMWELSNALHSGNDNQ